MKIRTSIVFALTMLTFSNVSTVSMANEAEALEPAFGESDSLVPMLPETSVQAQAQEPAGPQERTSSRRSAAPPAATPPLPRPTSSRTPSPASEGPMEVQIFELRYASAVDVSKLIMSVLGIQASTDGRLNRLIVRATQEQMQSVEKLIVAMDVAAPEASMSRNAQDLVYRVYMFEIPSEDEGMKSFMLRLQTPIPNVMPSAPPSAGAPAGELLDAAEGKELRIIEFLQTDGESPDSETETLIQGKAASEEALRRLVEKFPESRIVELRWDDDETFTGEIEAAHYSRLPDQLQSHIHKFLGRDVRTVGYWFGNLSAPGVVSAPIGPWTLRLGLETESNGMLDVRVDVAVASGARRLLGRPARMGSDEILSNSLRAKIGKPIIIGYNRESYGTRKMGAMVIVPEEDSL